MFNKIIIVGSLLFFALQLKAQQKDTLTIAGKESAAKSEVIKDDKKKENKKNEDKKKVEDSDDEDKKKKREDIIVERDGFKAKSESLEKKLKSTEAASKKSAGDIENLSEAVKKKEERIEELISEKNFLSRPQTTIHNQIWATGYLTREDVLFLVPDTKEINSLSDWNDAYSKNQPAFIYHENDKKKEFGVQVNLPALRKINEELKKRPLGWKLPDPSDIEKLKENLQKIKEYTLLNILTSNRVEAPSWKKKGIDLFGWNMPPLSFMRNESNNWYTIPGTASFVYVNENEDPGMLKSLSIVEMDESEQNYFFKLDKDIITGNPNYAVYVRLIKK
jgi:hypothetical protein